MCPALWTITVEAAHPDDVHGPLENSHHRAASLNHVETRQVRNDYRLPWAGRLYQIARQAITTGLRGADVRVEKRFDGEVAVCYGEKYLPVTMCAPAANKVSVPPPSSARVRLTGSRSAAAIGIKVRCKESAEALASGAGAEFGIGPQTERGGLRETAAPVIRRKCAKSKVRLCQGNSPHDRNL
jgi:hypothetical protein